MPQKQPPASTTRSLDLVAAVDAPTTGSGKRAALKPSTASATSQTPKTVRKNATNDFLISLFLTVNQPCRRRMRRKRAYTSGRTRERGPRSGGKSTSPHGAGVLTRVAVFGAGPSGLFLVDALLKANPGPLSIDVIDRLPAPYGLVRYGVAPDHPKIK